MPLPEGGHCAPDSGRQESRGIWTVSTAIRCHDRYDLMNMPFNSYWLKEWLQSFFSHWVFLDNQSGRLGGYVLRSPYRTVTCFVDLKHQWATGSR